MRGVFYFLELAGLMEKTKKKELIVTHHHHPASTMHARQKFFLYTTVSFFSVYLVVHACKKYVKVIDFILKYRRG